MKKPATFLGASFVPLFLLSSGAAATRTQTLINTDAHIMNALDLAHDGQTGKYLAVWVDQDGIFGKRLGRSGQPDGSATKTIAAGKGLYYPSVAGGDGYFLVMYSHAQGGSLGFVREGKLLDASTMTVAATVHAADQVNYLVPGGTAFVPNPSGQGAFYATYGKKNASGVTESWIATVYEDGTSSTPAKLVTAASCGMTIPEIAVNPKDGSALAVGYRDPTSTTCVGQSGIWARSIGSDGVPVGAQAWAVQGNGLHRYQKVVWNSARSQFQVLWSTKTAGIVEGTVRGRRMDAGTDAWVDAAYYDAQKGVKTDADKLNNGFSHIGAAYEPVSNRTFLEMRGSDVGDGKTLIYEQKLYGSTGRAVKAAPDRASSTTVVSPNSAVVADGNGNVLVLFRKGYWKLFTIFIQP